MKQSSEDNQKGLSTPMEGNFGIENFAFRDDSVLSELRIHYTTLGTPARDKAGAVCNAVLILHGTSGSGKAFLREQFFRELFMPGQLLDANEYYIVLPDGIGHGQSSKPSDGLRARFPHYGYHDMVQAQFQLLTGALGLDHLRLVMGTSMGGMHTWMWGELYPDFMDALMPLASLPVQIAGRNRMMRRMVMDSIRNDPTWMDGDYKEQPRHFRAAVYPLLFMVSSPLQWREQAPTLAEADQLFEKLVEDFAAHIDANDLLYQFDASRDYDPAPALDQIRAPLLAINSADDQVNPPELGILEREIERVKRGCCVVLPISDKTRGHRTHSLPEIWKPYLAELMEESKRQQT